MVIAGDVGALTIPYNLWCMSVEHHNPIGRSADETAAALSSHAGRTVDG
jgi:hypothetical protein